MIAHAFVQGTACPCIFLNVELDVVVSAHGDDFTAVGPRDSLDQYEAMLEKAYELKKGGRLGPGAEDDNEATCLNQIIRWGADGIEYEADPRQAEKLIEEMGLEGANPVVTPGVKALPAKIEDDKALNEDAHTQFRGFAARANYLAPTGQIFTLQPKKFDGG